MKKFVIETNQNYVEVMKRILSDCDVTGNLQPELKTYLGETKDENKLYNCYVAGNKLSIEMKIPYRNSFTSTMNLEVLINGDKTRINGSISSILSSKFLRKMFGIFVLIFSIYWLITPFRFSHPFEPVDWIYIITGALLFLSSIPLIFNDKKKRKPEVSDEPYGVQMEHWISNLFPGEFKQNFREIRRHDL